MHTSRPGVFAALIFSIVFGGSLIASAPANAQDDIRARGDRACKTDARRLCTHAIQGGDMAVLSCFQENKVKLTAPCRKFLVEVGQLQ